MKKKRLPNVDLALQGGGSHGAFTWGVLDALLEDGRLQFEGVTGASAGAMNAVIMADGWARGLAAKRDPRERARQQLKKFWDAITAQSSPFSATLKMSDPVAMPAMDWMLPQSMRETFSVNPIALWLDLVSRMFSPYQLNPLNYNPLESVLKPLVDFERLRASAPFKLFICATNVRTGRARVFREHELTIEMLLASACLPFAFQAVEVIEHFDDGRTQREHYWDGGYMGNPALFPLFYATRTRDIVLVQINPMQRFEVPNTAQEIIERANEISFNSSLMHELRAIAFVQRLLKENRLDPKRYKHVLMHRIAAEDQMRTFGACSKNNTSPAFVRQLFELGRSAAQDWLDQKASYLGRASSVPIGEVFL